MPALTDLDALLKRLSAEERELSERTAELEEEIRKFEDLEKPAYEQWIRLSFGPKLVALDELILQIHALRVLIRRIDELMESHHLHPREALYMAKGMGREPEEEESQEAEARSTEKKAWSQEEVEARRDAKREAKREARRESRREAKREAMNGKQSGAAAPSGQRLTSVYRSLARRLHPDSAHYLRSWPESRVRSLWAEVQKAYQASSLERLLAIQVWLESEGEADSESAAAPRSERHQRIRSLKKAFSQLEKRFQQMTSHPAWGFSLSKGKAREKLRKSAAREVEEELAQAQEALESLEEFIASIGPPRPPKIRVRRGGGRG